MGRIERICDLNPQIQHILLWHRLPTDQMFERLPIQKLHGNERLAFVPANLVNGANMWMIERGCRLRFALESFKRLVIFGQILWQEFQSDKAMKECVLRLIDHTHPTATELFDDAVMGNRLANQGLDVCHFAGILSAAWR